MRKLILIPALLLAVAGSAHGATATAAKNCGHPDYPGSGYYLSMSAKHTSCGKAKSVANAYTACRHEHGLKGKCSRKVKGYTCTEKRGEAIDTEFDASVKCHKGAKRVKFFYQQNT